MDLSKVDVTKVNIRCDGCGSMAGWCEPCDGFKCNKCKQVKKLSGVTIKPRRKSGGCIPCGKNK